MISPTSTTTTPERSKDRPSPLFEAAQVSAVGIEMAVSTFVGWGFGYWLDSKLATGPWLMLIGLLLGVVAGFRGLIRTAQRVRLRSFRGAEFSAEFPGGEFPAEFPAAEFRAESEAL